MLISEPIATSSTVAIGFWFSVGSRLEKEGCRGITHFTEHLIFKGTTTKSTHDIACTFDRIGGYINAYTERENVCVYCVVPSSENNIRIAVNTLCDLATNASFPEDEMERERIVVENEVTSCLDDAEESALDCVSSSVWPNQSISCSITGSIKDVESITRKQVIDWYNKYFVNGELTVLVAGNMKEEMFMDELLKLPLHSKPLIYPKQKHYDENPKWSSGTRIVKASFNQSQIFTLYPFHSPISEKENFILSIFNALTGDTMSSRLFEALREKSGYCYSVYSFFSFYEDAVAWCAYCSCDKKHVLDVISILEDQLNKLLTDEITDMEIEAAKQHLCGEETISSEDMEYCIKRNQRNYSMGFDIKSTDETIEALRKIKKSDIIEFIHVLLDQSKRAVIYYGPGLSYKTKKEILCKTKLK